MSKGGKLRSGIEENLLCGTCIQVGITNVTCVCLNIFQFSQGKKVRMERSEIALE